MIYGMLILIILLLALILIEQDKRTTADGSLLCKIAAVIKTISDLKRIIDGMGACDGCHGIFCITSMKKVTVQKPIPHRNEFYCQKCKPNYDKIIYPCIFGNPVRYYKYEGDVEVTEKGTVIKK